jgi:two-component system, LuxR family, sensor kinase FixL
MAFLTRAAAWPSAGFTAAVAVAFLVLYMALDWVSFVHPMRGANISPWSPQCALAVALLLWRKDAFWLVWLAGVAGEAILRVDPAPLLATAVTAGLLAGAYLGIAIAIGRLGIGAQGTTSRRDVLLFLLVAIAGALAAALLRVGAWAALDVVPADRLLPAVHRGWVGDAAGLLVLLPLLLVLGSRIRREASAALARTPEFWLIGLTSAVAVAVVFARPAEDLFKYFYVLFVPVIWAAARFGAIGSVWTSAVVQLLVLTAFHSARYVPLTVFELQTLMAVLASTGLLLGSTLDEREEAARRLRESLRMAAAADMSAALAHELNQPLTALSSYAMSAQFLAEQLRRDNPEAAGPLVQVTQRLVDEASRSAEVIRRLRDFFRNRSSEFLLTELGPLLQDCACGQQPRARSCGVQLRCQAAADLPPVWVDRVQIAVVVRNLIANALDAATAAPGPHPAVLVEAVPEGARAVVVSVLDSGRGVAPGDLQRVFEHQVSAKPGGMGVGLSISRAIVEAHGGRLWAEPGPGGRFHFTIPIGGPHE